MPNIINIHGLSLLLLFKDLHDMTYTVRVYLGGNNEGSIKEGVTARYIRMFVIPKVRYSEGSIIQK